MKSHITPVTTLRLTLLMFFFSILSVQASAGRQFYQLIIYHLADENQEARLDKFLSEAYLPELRRSGIAAMGVYYTAGIDTAADKRILILIPFRSLEYTYAVSQIIEKSAF